MLPAEPVDQPYLIGIAGPSGSGKTELSRRLAATLPAEIVSLDSYYRELAHLSFEERARFNFDAPESIDQDLLAGQLAALAEGQAVATPVYDFTRHTRAAAVHYLQPGGFVILEGLFALYWEDIRGLLSTKVFIAAEDRVCFERRLARDVRERARSPRSVFRQYTATVHPMAERYVLPGRRHADVAVSGTDPIERSVAAVLAHIEVRVLSSPASRISHRRSRRCDAPR